MTGTGGSAHRSARGYAHRAENRSFSLGQSIALTALVVSMVWGIMADPSVVGQRLILLAQFGFLAAASWRVLLILASRRVDPAAPPTADLPRYTVLAALLDEAEVLPQLIQRLDAIDYPRRKLEGFLLLEAHDHATRAAAAECNLPGWIKVMIVPPGGPRTKPAALNVGLAAASGVYITVYDAEDDPDPLQLQEAAARFAADRSGRLATLQAPLRIRPHADSTAPFIDRHFAVEYAGLFEVTLPAMARLGLPFPLGGTSNHFDVAALRDVGGWDAHNVTEDADLGFRLWRYGYRLGTMRLPTWETPPGELADWLPQRTRWLKGFMQTWGVHTRSLLGLGWRGILALVMTLGMSLAAAAAHAPSLAWVVASGLITLAAGLPLRAPTFALSVLLVGMASAWMNGKIGARRAGITYTIGDMVVAPAYWSLMSLAFGHAVWRVVKEPFAWDKTRHRRDQALDIADLAEVDAGREAA